MKRWRFRRCKCCARAWRLQSSFTWAMWSLAAAISPGYFGFTDCAFAAEAPSEIAVQIPIAICENKALDIISSPILPCNQLAPQHTAVQVIVPECSFDRCDGHHEIIDLRVARFATTNFALAKLFAINVVFELFFCQSCKPRYGLIMPANKATV
jgi:hypothetical protein